MPHSAFLEGRRSLGSRRLKCSGFGLQHLWFCYRRRSRMIAGVTPVDGLGFTHDKFTLRIERNHDVNHGTLHVLLLTYSSIFGSFVERLYRTDWRQRCFQSGREHGREGQRGGNNPSRSQRCSYTCWQLRRRLRGNAAAQSTGSHRLQGVLQPERRNLFVLDFFGAIGPRFRV